MLDIAPPQKNALFQHCTPWWKSRESVVLANVKGVCNSVTVILALLQNLSRCGCCEILCYTNSMSVLAAEAECYQAWKTRGNSHSIPAPPTLPLWTLPALCLSVVLVSPIMTDLHAYNIW